MKNSALQRTVDYFLGCTIWELRAMFPIIKEIYETRTKSAKKAKQFADDSAAPAPKQKRKRRTKAQIEADEAKAQGTLAMSAEA